MKTPSRAVKWRVTRMALSAIAVLATVVSARAGFAPYPYTEGFEAGADTNYWTLQGTWSVTSETNHAGTKCLTDSPGGIYAASADTTATLGVDLRFAVRRPMLSFWQINALQDGVDYGFVEVSADQGTSWTRLAATTGNAMLNWFQVKVDLAAYAGTQVLIRFHLRSDGSYQYDGWYIDDIVVAENPTVFAYPFYDGMNTAASQTNWFASTWRQVTGSATNAATGMSYLCGFGGGWQPGGLSVNIPMTLVGTFDFSSVPNPKLSFWWRASAQQNNTLYAQISTDGGKGWSTIWSWGSYWGNSMAWSRVQVDLNSYIGYTNVTFRFLAYNPVAQDLAVNFQIDEVLIDDAPLDVSLTVSPGTDPRHNAVLNWTATPATDFGYYALYRATSPNVNPSTAKLVTAIGTRLTTSFQDTNLDFVGVTYYYRLVVWDNQGLRNWGTNEVSYMARYGQLVTSLPFTEGFEGTDANWSLDRPWAISSQISRTGSKCLASNPGVNYAASTDSAAYVNVDLNGANRPVLTFWHRYGFEPNRDFGFVEAWLGSWTRLYGVTGQSGTNWSKVQIDLGGYTGAQILLRFRLMSDGGNQYDGWFIDDVSIQDFGSVSLGSAFYDSMDTPSTLTNWIGSIWQPSPSSFTTNGTNMGWRCQLGSGYQPGGLSMYSGLTLAGSLNLSGAINPKLRFGWRAANQQNNSLNAQVSTDNGKNWATVWSWGSYWGNGSAWSTNQIDLGGYIAYTNVTLRFLAVNPVAQDLYMDFQIDDLRVDDAPLDVTTSIGPGPDPRNSAQLNWSASTAADFACYAIYRSTSAGVNLSSQLITVITNKATTSFIDNSLGVVGQTYYYRVIVWDNQGLHNWGAADLSYRTAYGQVVTTLPFSESFVGSGALWALDVPWGVTTETSHTGTTCLGSNPGGSYGYNTDASAYLNINLTGAVRPMLTFWQQYGFEPNRDYGFVEVSLNQGASWTRLYGVTSQSGAVWNKVQIDLGSYAGSLALIRFRLISDSANPYTGWFIDDIEIKDYGTVAMGYPFYDAMETTSSESNWLASAWQLVPGGATSVTGNSWRCLIGNGYQPGGLTYYSALTLNGSMNLAGAVSPKLWFWWRAASQQNNSLYAQLSTDNGKNWATVWSWGSYWGYGAAWNRVQVDISSYAGYTNLILRFLAANPVAQDLYVDFQVDGILVAPGGDVPAILTSSPMPAATLGFAYSQTLLATNAPTPYTWAVVSNTLPPGLSLNATNGILDGSPTALGAYTFWLGVTASNGLTATKRFTLAVQDNLAVAPQHYAQPFSTPGTNVVNCLLDNQTGRRLLSLVWTPTLPAGWTVVSATGQGTPEVGPDGKILFQAEALTNTPLTFSYKVRVPSAQTLSQTIGGAATLLLDGMAVERTLPASPDPLVVLPRTRHAADCNTNWIIESTEASRVLAYWRAQTYHLDSSSCDGYASGLGDQVGPLHTADYLTPAWFLNGTEVNRVLAYWRAGCYKADATGADGFSAGCGKDGGETKGDVPTVVQQVPLSYRAGSTLTITNRITYTNSLLSLLCRPSLPAGWTITQVLADGSPEWLGGEMVWTAQKLPASPVVVAYVVQVPQGEQGAKNVANEIEYQAPAMANAASINATPTPAVVLPAFLRFTSLQRLENGSAKLDIAGAVDNPIRVLAGTQVGSTNWSTLVTLPKLSGTTSFTDTNTAANTVRFYRLVSP